MASHLQDYRGNQRRVDDFELLLMPLLYSGHLTLIIFEKATRRFLFYDSKRGKMEAFVFQRLKSAISLLFRINLNDVGYDAMESVKQGKNKFKAIQISSYFR